MYLSISWIYPSILLYLKYTHLCIYLCLKYIPLCSIYPYLEYTHLSIYILNIPIYLSISLINPFINLELVEPTHLSIYIDLWIEEPKQTSQLRSPNLVASFNLRRTKISDFCSATENSDNPTKPKLYCTYIEYDYL